MSAAVSNQDTRFLLSMTPPPSDRGERDRERERAGRSIRTLLDLLTTEKMDGSDSTTRSTGTTTAGSRWRTLRERLGLKGIGCCGAATWRDGSSPTVDDDNEDENGVVMLNLQESQAQESGSGLGSGQEITDLFNINTSRNTNITRHDLETGESRSSSPGGMNLAAALAAERQFRAVASSGGDEVAPPPRTPLRVSLMRLLEETGDKGSVGIEVGLEKENEMEMVGNDSMCCVCMGRKKGAALIPCGHTYCRVCSREVWVNRGSCPLCNRPILEILDIF